MLNKILIFSFLFIFSCGDNRAKKNDVEIFCPQFGQKILVENASSSEVYEAIQDFMAQKIREKTNENYTILRFRGGASMSIKKIPPEEMLKCSLRDVPRAVIRGYILR